MRKLIWMAAALTLLAGPASRAQDEDLSSPKLRVGWAEFKTLHDANKVLLIDVRDSESFALGHIPGAISIPLAEVEQQAARLKREKRPLVIYCA